MKNYLKILGTIVLVFILFIVYLIFFLGNNLILIFMIIGSVAAVSTSTMYTVIHYEVRSDERKTKRKFSPKSKSIKLKSKSIHREIPIIFENYFDTLPYLKDYVESDESYEDNLKIKDSIFSVFSQDELDKINLLGLSQLEKLQFLSEMFYYDAEEREILIENMLRSRGKTGENVIYSPPSKTIKLGKLIHVHIISLVERGEKRKILDIDTSELISEVKQKAGKLFNYNLKDFLLTSGGIILQEDSEIQDYPIEEDDEIVLIPSRKEKK